MKYIKACDILPEHLITEIQKYVEGHTIYIPSKIGTRKSWGEKNGTKQEYIKRNNEIRIAYKRGNSIDKLSEKYCLSVYTIKKIIYSR
ncbi:CD3324 family protein [Tepidibacter hydrothermalis]|uniref:CD3324 family protein n=1 Tax=Tepidibacter hydrothermalis TaxID=3036126 RepID=A0ABY8EH46_9FIRM|nr:CD3324 family protein [Tepidibacter hydrothermalis]WFD10909.1 CD3324 family protein [Tepidibacter hydrothermalis]